MYTRFHHNLNCWRLNYTRCFPYDNWPIFFNLKVGCLHPIACTRSGSGFPSNVTLFWIFYSITATCFGRMTIFKRIYICSGYWIKYSKQCCITWKPWTWPIFLRWITVNLEIWSACFAFLSQKSVIVIQLILHNFSHINLLFHIFQTLRALVVYSLNSIKFGETS
jgi:hypothetical protein